MNEQAHTVLVVDDEPAVRNALKCVLEERYRILLAPDGPSAIETLHTDGRVEVMLLDMVMPGVHGIEVLRQVREQFSSVEVIVLSALQAIETVIEAINLGAFDYVSKPFVGRELTLVVDRAIELRTLKKELTRLRERHTGAAPDEIVGTSIAILDLRRTARELAGETEPFLVVGERGTGKELFARTVHRHGEHASRSFTVVRCCDLAKQQAFRTLAQQDHAQPPLVEPAALGLPPKGFVFFRDAQELDGTHQLGIARLIEALQDGGVRCAASALPKIASQLDAGQIDPAFYRRISRTVVAVPALRERYEDIAPLSERFLAQLRPELNARAETFRADALEELEAYPWPGNVRELRNFIERLLILHADAPVIERQHLPDEIGATAARALSATDFIGKKTLKEAVNELERRIIMDALRRTSGVQTRASELLGTTRRILRYRMRQLGIE